jgi:hypothetical protein
MLSAQSAAENSEKSQLFHMSCYTFQSRDTVFSIEKGASYDMERVDLH